MQHSCELLPCPFCGGEAHQWHHPGLWGIFSHSIQCDACHVALEECSDDSYDVAMAAAVERWNTRAERTCRNVGPEGKDIFTCSECGATTFRFVGMPCEPSGRLLDVQTGYCPNCGAKVVGS